MPYIAHTLIWLTVSFVLPNHKQFIRVNRMLYIAHTFIWLPVSFVLPRRKRLIELNRMPCIAHATKIWTVFDASSICKRFAPFLTDFLHHCLRLLHRTQFRRRVSDRSVALAASCSSGSSDNTYACTREKCQVVYHPRRGQVSTCKGDDSPLCMWSRCRTCHSPNGFLTWWCP